MRACPECTAEVPDDAGECPACGTAVGSHGSGTSELFADADYDPESERREFERRYGIDIGDLTVDEYLQHLDQQDYSLTAWFWSVVAAQVVGVALFVLDPLAGITTGVPLFVAFPVISIVMAVAVFGDTQTAGLFKPGANIRWVYVLMAAIPLFGHVATLQYLLLRRLKREQTAKRRRRLLDAGFNLRFE